MGSRVLLALSFCWLLCFVSICNATLLTREVVVDAGAEVQVQTHIVGILVQMTNFRNDYQAAIEARA